MGGLSEARGSIGFTNQQRIFMKLEKIQLNMKAMQCRDDHYNAVEWGL
jgi:hypothetical protein